MRRYLSRVHGWERNDEQALIADCRRQIDDAVETYLDTPPQAPTSMFDFLYAELPAPLAAQRAAVEEQG
jgi:pyruvate dehydrogenase E1 component alpha subunit